MSEKFYTILTNIGKAKIANSGVMGSKVNFVKFKIGDSNGSYYEPTEAQRDLIHTVYEGNITDIEVDKNNPNWIKINLMIPANVGGFTIREYGVFDESGNMLAVAKCAESYKPVAEDGSTKELILRMILAVSNTSSVNMELDPTLVFVSKDELEKVRQELTLHLKDLDKDSYPIVEATGTNAYIGASARIKVVGKGIRCTLFVGTASNGNCSLNL
ncbi:MAG: phage tail protein, partial [Clostridium butyricum]